MIERLKESGGAAFGFRVVGKLSDEDLKTFEPQLEFFIAQNKKHPIGILSDLTEMSGPSGWRVGKTCGFCKSTPITLPAWRS
jgi:hypothetical protein